MVCGIWCVVSQLVEQPVSLASQIHISLTDGDGLRADLSCDGVTHKVISTKSRPTVNI